MTGSTESAGAGTRERILAAATEIVQGADAARFSVRSVAARAGVGMGTLRYHFPTQRALLDAVLASMYEAAMPDERIRDRTVPARERLRECLGQMLSAVGVGAAARETWGELYRTFVAPDASDDARAGYRELQRQTSRRVESWLSILVEEGVLEPGDNAVRSEFLLAVVDGLALQRALPSTAAPVEVENRVLAVAIQALPISGP